MRVVVSVATSPHHIHNQLRLYRQLKREHMMFWDQLPEGSPPHSQEPYAFKVYAIEKAIAKGYDSILWCDSSIVVLKPLEPLWKLIESQGYWFSKNYDYNQGQFCNDEALKIMGRTREEAFGIPQVVGGCFGLNIDLASTANLFLWRWGTLLRMGAFRGDRGDLSGDADMTKFVGHRNDQACASEVCYALGMKLTDPPAWFAEQGRPITDETILTVER